MNLTKRHEEVAQLLVDPTALLEVVEFEFNLTQLRVSKKTRLRFSNGTIRRNANPDCVNKNVRLDNERTLADIPRLDCALFNGISIRRLFQINMKGAFSWSLITTEKYADADFERFKRFIERRIATLKMRPAEKLPGWVRLALKNAVMVTDDQRDGKGVDPVHTTCRDCIFAKYEGKTQVGCSFNGQLDKFREAGNVVEAFDHELEFSVVNKRCCPAHRTADWARDIEIPKGFTITQVVRNQIAARIDYLIVVNEQTTEPQLEDSLRSIMRQSHKPHSILLAANQNKWKRSKFLSIMDKLVGTDVNWRVTSLLRRQPDDAFFPDSEAVDETFPRCTGHMYVRIVAGTKLPKDMGKQIDTFVTDDLQQFSVMEGTDELQAEVVHRGFHKFVNGNQAMPVDVPGEVAASETPQKPQMIRKTLYTLPEKARFYEDAQNTNGMLLKVTDVCK